MTLTFVTAKCEMVKYTQDLRHIALERFHIQSTLVIRISDAIIQKISCLLLFVETIDR